VSSCAYSVRLKSRIAAIVLVGLLALLQAGSALATQVATTTYYFTGTCTRDCTGNGTGTLVVANYTLGQPLTSNNLVSFTYTSGFLGTVTITGGSPAVLSGTLPAVLPGFSTQTVIVSNTNQAGPSFLGFNAYAGGTWCIGYNSYCNADSGTGGTWSTTGSTPTPTATTPVGTPALGTPALISLALMFGLAGFIVLKRAVKPAAR